MAIQFYAFLISVLYGGEWSAQASPILLHPVKNGGNYCAGDLVDSEPVLKTWRRATSLPSKKSNVDPAVVQLAA